MPEAEQGFNVARLISLMGLKVDDVPGVTINRFCASGLETVAIATAKIKSGMSDCIIAGGVESMSYIPMTGFKPVPNYNTVSSGKEDYYWGMGLTAEQVANDFSISREDQDKFAFEKQQAAYNELIKQQRELENQKDALIKQKPTTEELGQQANEFATVDTTQLDAQIAEIDKRLEEKSLLKSEINV